MPDHEHYKAVRESPEYRMWGMMEEMRNEMQPPLSPPSPPDSIDPNIDKKVYIYNKEDIDSMQGHVVWLQNKLNEHIDRHKKKKGDVLELS